MGIINKCTIIVISICIGGCAPIKNYGKLPRGYIFVDGGAHFGESFMAFKKTKLYSQHPWEIYAIEARPDLIEKIPRIPRLTIINKAIWIEDGYVDFYLTESSYRASLFKFSTTHKREPIKVESFDFGKWLQGNFSKNDYIIVSFDICGAEFYVLRKMLTDKTIEYVDRLYVEFIDEDEPDFLADDEGVSGIARTRGKELLERISKLGVIVGDDSADDIIERGDWIDYLE